MSSSSKTSEPPPAEFHSPELQPIVFRTRRKVARVELVNFLGEISKRVLRGRTLICLITTDEELRQLNRQYRKKDYATDVLSFRNEDARKFAGDLAISADRARAQATEHGHSIDDELRILMLHGALHLAGMDHETDHGEMARAEMRWRKVFALPLGLIQRVGLIQRGRMERT